MRKVVIFSEIITPFGKNLYIQQSFLQATKITFNDSVFIPWIKRRLRSKFLSCKSSLIISKVPLFNFARSILLAEGTNFRPLDNKEISGEYRFLLDRLKEFLLANLPSNLNPL